MEVESQEERRPEQGKDDGRSLHVRGAERVNVGERAGNIGTHVEWESTTKKVTRTSVNAANAPRVSGSVPALVVPLDERVDEDAA